MALKMEQFLSTAADTMEHSIILGMKSFMVFHPWKTRPTH